MTEPPIVAMDESGFTGDNLLDEAQPVYALAAIQLDAATSDAAVAHAKQRCGRPELKFAELRYHAAEREVMFELFEALSLSPATARVSVAHKPWMVAAKMVELLIEPRKLAQGRQFSWYEAGLHKDTASLLFGRGPTYLGEHWPPLQSSFVAMVRRFNERTAHEYIRAVAAARDVCDNVVMSLILGDMIDSWDELADNIPGSKDQLDPTPGCLYWQAGEWSSVLPDFAIVHDDRCG
jgi:hypothetical protein